MESESLQVEAGQRVLYEHTKVSSIPRSCSAARYRLQHSSKCASPVDSMHILYILRSKQYKT